MQRCQIPSNNATNNRFANQPVGTTMQIACVGSGGWTIAQNTGQSINIGN
jgi:hypothetical protein